MGDEIESLLTEARNCQRHLSENLPVGVDPLAFSNLRSKTPYVALCYREGQYFRVEEFARAACDLFERNDVVAGVTAVRAMAESAACVWYLYELLKREAYEELSPDIHSRLVALLMGHRSDEGFPTAVNVLKIIEKADKKIPGLRRNYDLMSEFAHPNYAGCLGIYGTRDEKTLITYFDRSEAKSEYGKKLGLNSLLALHSMVVFSYNEINDILPDFEAHIEAAQ